MQSFLRGKIFIREENYPFALLFHNFYEENFMKKIFLIFIQLFIFSFQLLAIDTISAKYFPLSVGNKWVYLNGSTSGGPIYYSTSTTKITKDTIIYGKKYFFINNIPFTNRTNFWIRYDSTNGQLKWFYEYAVSCNYENMIYDLSAILGDTCNNSAMQCVVNNYVCNNIIDSLLWGINSRVKTYYYYYVSPGGMGFHINKFAKSVGYLYLQQTYSGNYYACTYGWLKGFVINGQVYGDTSTTAVTAIGSKVPEHYSLSQNYPNPFNPSTIIEFQIKEMSSPHVLSGDLVTLKIYDILGKEVATLVNEKLSPGVYEVTFDGSQYPSGVYFYRLETQSYKETKKMLMIK